MYLVYGAGKVGNEFLNQCKEKQIENIILTDSNPHLWNKIIDGFEVINPDKINYNKIKLAIISTGSNYYKEIKEKLSAKLSEDKIAFYNEVFLFSPQDILNLGSICIKKNISYTGILKKEQLVQCFDKNSFNDLDRFFYQKKHRLINKVIHYTEAYNRFFTKYRGKKVTLLEIGVYKGGSLQMWKDYLGEDAQIIGLDINPECKKLEEENIKVYIGDQEDRNYLQAMKKQIGQIDIIVDDGGHTMKQQIASFEELFAALSEGGVYLCEDCMTSYWADYNGGYKKGDTFIEYSKKMIDGLNAQYIEENVSEKFKYKDEIKSLTFYDGMVFIEKRKKTNKSIVWEIETQ